jgi:hypothetical protein
VLETRSRTWTKHILQTQDKFIIIPFKLIKTVQNENYYITLETTVIKIIVISFTYEFQFSKMMHAQ